MRINPITINTNRQNNKPTNHPNFTGVYYFKPIKGFLDGMIPRLTEDMAGDAGKNLCLFNSITNRINEKMGKFSVFSKLNFKQKAEKEYLVFIEHPSSNYKEILPNFKLSETGSVVDDLKAYEELANNVENTNQFEVERKFCQMRNEHTLRSEFEPKL